MNLVNYWVVGFAGARRLAQSDAIRDEIGKVLRDLKEIADGELVAISSVAIGSDLLFVEETARLKIPWIAVLPFPTEYFFNEKDFPDGSERDAARKALAEAVDCEIIAVPRHRDEATDALWRHAALADAGFKCVDESDVVIAVVEETKAGKPGGTSEIVAYAKARERPILIIDPETLKIRRENWPTRLRDALTDELRQLPFVPLSADKRQGYPTPTALALADCRNSFAEPARKRKFQIRWSNVAVVLLSAFAAFITALVFLLFEPAKPDSQWLGHDLRGWTPGLEWVALACVSSALFLLLLALLQKPQARTADYRFAAEVGRSLLMVWNIPGIATRVLRSSPTRFAHFVKSLLLQYRLDPDRLRDQPLSESQVRDLASNYLNTRVRQQLDEYYSPTHEKSRRLSAILEWSTITLSIIAVISAGVLAFTDAKPGDLSRSVWALIKLAAAIAIPVAVSMLAIYEVKRREARYGEMTEVLKQYAQRIGHARSLSTLQDLVVDVEHLFLSETYEWWILAKENVAA